MLPTIGITELLIVFFIVLVLFGAKRIPELGRSLGEGIKGLRHAMRSEEEEEEKEKPSPKAKTTS